MSAHGSGISQSRPTDLTDAQFASALLDWYEHAGRKDLPWQIHPTPYRVWVSEIMLQQTQVNTVIPYYQRFMQRFPDVRTLASASQDEVLHLWSGLGYYARGRHLHQAAKDVVTHHGGELPTQLASLTTLPGIGRSTAGAILALALNQRHAILDGNVKRVLYRYYALTDVPGKASTNRKLWMLAENHTPKQQVDRYSQAIMDLGATVCTRSKPVCSACPVRTGCQAYRQDNPTAYPPKKSRNKMPTRHSTLLILKNNQGKLLLEKRPPSGIWGGLWSLPEINHRDCDASSGKKHQTGDYRNWCRHHLNIEVSEMQPLTPINHTFSHFHLVMTPLFGQVQKYIPAVMETGNFLWYHSDELNHLGLAAPIARLLKQINHHLAKEKLG